MINRLTNPKKMAAWCSSISLLTRISIVTGNSAVRPSPMRLSKGAARKGLQPDAGDLQVMSVYDVDAARRQNDPGLKGWDHTRRLIRAEKGATRNGLRSDAGTAAIQISIISDDTGRSQYDPGFEGWDHSAGGYLTDYIIYIEGTVLGLMVLLDPSLKSNIGARHFVNHALLTGVAFGAGGLAHHMLDIYFQDGQVMGRSWGAMNSGWMYPWTLTSLSAVGSSAGASQAFSFTLSDKEWVYGTLYGLGIIVVLIETIQLIREQLDGSGTFSGLSGISFSILGIIFAFAGTHEDGKTQVLGGSVFMFIAYSFLAFGVPSSCKTVGAEREGCPFPEAFNHNAVFHVFIIISTLLYFLAAKSSGNMDPRNVNTESENEALIDATVEHLDKKVNEDATASAADGAIPKPGD